MSAPTPSTIADEISLELQSAESNLRSVEKELRRAAVGVTRIAHEIIDNLDAGESSLGGPRLYHTSGLQSQPAALEQALASYLAADQFVRTLRTLAAKASR